jgi:predicted O-methyltransferase YrrM
MSRDTWNAVDSYLVETLIGEDSALGAALDDSEAAGLPMINVAPNQGKLLHLLARISGAKTILEMGTLGGYSTIWLARALPEDGRLVTLEYSPKHAEVARKNIDRAGVGDRVEIIVGPALESLPRLESEGRGPFDLIFIDADKSNYPGYLDWSLKLSRPGTVIIGDNVVRSGKVLDTESDDADVQGARTFLKIMGEHPRIDATAFQTVGSKGYDGLAVGIVTD